MKTKIEGLENLLHRMRAQTWGTRAEQEERQYQCWVLSGTIEDLKNGRTPVLEAAQKYL
jgi:hypothetical protein